MGFEKRTSTPPQMRSHTGRVKGWMALLITSLMNMEISRNQFGNITSLLTGFLSISDLYRLIYNVNGNASIMFLATVTLTEEERLKLSAHTLGLSFALQTTISNTSRPLLHSPRVI